MKKLLFVICFLVFFPLCVLPAQNCQDYTCNIAKARTALNNKKFKEAIDYCKAAKAYPNANIAEADALIYKVFEEIEAQKRIAEAATKKAKAETENAKREKLKAEAATKRAEKTARAAENTAAFMKIRSEDSTLAMRMMYYNYMHHPEDKFTRDIYHQTINNQQSSFLLKTFRGHQGEITTVVFSPDGKKVLSGSSDGTVKLWNLDSGKAEKTFVGHTMNVRAVTLSPDGKEMLTGSMDKTVRLWKMGSERAEKAFIRHKESVFAVAFSPDGKKVLTGSDDNTAKLWNIESEKVEKTFIGHTKSVIAVAFSRDGKKILTASSDKLVKLWDIENENAEKTFTCYTAVAYNVVVAFSFDGKKILTSNGDDTKLWDIQSGKAEKTFIGHQRYVIAVAFSQDGKKILTGSHDNTAKLWDIESEKAEKTFIGHIGGVTTVAFSHDGKKVLTGSTDKTVKLWDIGSEKAEKTNRPTFYCCPNTVFSSDRKRMLVGSDGMAKLWDIESEKTEKTFITNSDFRAIAFSPDEKKILTANADMTVKLWDIESEKVEKTFTDFTSYVNAIVFSSDGKKMLTAINNTVLLRDIGSGKVEKMFMGHKDDINAVVFSPDGKKILTASKDNTAKLWDIENEKVEKTFTVHTYNVDAIAFSPDGKKILTTSRDNTAKLWDIENEKVEKTFIGHSGYITTVAFSSDGKKALTGSIDMTVKLWDIESGKAEKTFIGHSGYITTVAFSSDGRQVLTSSWDNTIKLWDIEKGAIEGWIYAFSLYDMAQAGLKFEPEDMSRYIADSMAFAYEVKQDSLNYEQAIEAWGYSADYKQFIKKLIAWNSILITQKTQTRDPKGIRFGRYTDSYKEKKQYDYWEEALTSFESDKYLAAYEAFFKYLRDNRENNVEWIHTDDGYEFEILHGSKRVKGTADTHKFITEAQIVKNQNLDIAVMRRLIEQSYNLEYCRYALDSANNLIIKFSSNSMDASPYKLYYALKEIAVNADSQDDLLISEFGNLVTPIDENLKIKLPDSIQAIKYRFLIDKASSIRLEIEQSKLDGEKYPGGISYLLLDNVYRLDFLTKPEGFTKGVFERIHHRYFDNKTMPMLQKNNLILKDFDKIQNRSKDLIYNELYDAKFTFGVLTPKQHEALVSLIDSELPNRDWYEKNGYSKVALAIPSYIVGFSLFSYTLPEADRELLTLYYKIFEPDYFTSLNFFAEYWNPKSGLFDQSVIKKAIKAITDKHLGKFPKLTPNLSVLNFESESKFAASYLLMLRNLDFTQ